MTDAALTATVVSKVLAERQRQISEEGWTPEHDAHHDKGELILAARCYYNHAALVEQGLKLNGVPAAWPWRSRWWKPASPERDLIRAGALCLAEVDRLRARGETAASVDRLLTDIFVALAAI